MKSFEFPLFKTKTEGTPKRFNLNDPAERKEYFALKCGNEVEKIRRYLERDAFIGYLLGKKNSGKGTYSKLFMEAVGSGNVGHVAVGDIVRDVHAALSDEKEKKALTEFLEKQYRGFHTVGETLDLIEGRSQEKLISTELILALLKYEVSRRARQALFIDGFPRGLDQVGYSLFLKELLGYREEPDFFVFIDVPESVIDERIKYRVICPLCKTPRSTKLLATKEVRYDEAAKEFYLVCDNPQCRKARLVPKEGDELGIGPLRRRLQMDDKIFEQLLALQGVPKVKLRNSIPVSAAAEYVDEYELTPEYYFERDAAGRVGSAGSPRVGSANSPRVKILEKPWIIKDDNGVPSYSLLPPAIVISLIKQVAEVLGL